MGYYTLDVDTGSLSSVQTALETLSNHLSTHADTISGAPAELGSSWTGTAATAVKTEMTGLGTECKQFAPQLADAATAVGTFIAAVRVAQDSVDGLNRQYTTANQGCTDAINAAERARTTAKGSLASGDTAGSTAADTTYDAARGQAGDTLRWTMQGIAYGYDEAVRALEAAAAALGSALQAATVVPVSDQTVYAYQNGGVPASLLAALRRSALSSMDSNLNLPEDKQQQADGAAAASDFSGFAGTGPHTKDEIDAFLARLHPGDEAFRQAFLKGLDPAQLAFLQRVSHLGVDQQVAPEYGAVVTAVSQMLAIGSNTATQGTYPVPGSVYDRLRETYRALQVPPGEGYLLLAEVVQAGQGDGATWDTGLVTAIAKDTIAFERHQQQQQPGWAWGQIYGTGNGTLPTQAARDLTGDVPGREDALSLLFEALGHDPAAAQDVLAKPDGTADTDLLHWLYDGRAAQGSWLTWGYALGQTLDAGTTFVGPGTEGTRDYASAQIVADLVHFYGTHPDRYPITMDQSMVNILSHHVQAVNYASEDGEGAVNGNHPDGALEYQRIAMANLDSGDLSTLLRNVFGEDYYAQHGDSADPAKGFPMYQQLSAAQHAAFRRDFLDLASEPPLDQGRLIQLATQQGMAETDLAHALRDALTAQGASADQATADAKAAVDFVLGLGIDKLPIDKLGGPAGTVGGLAIDAIKNQALDAIFPDEQLAQNANSEGLSVQEYLARVRPLEYVSMLDQAGLLQGNDSAAAWARDHPQDASFVQGGHLVDLADLYAHRDQRPEQWNDFLYYYQEHGDSVLNELGLQQGFTLGFLTSDDRHSGSGG